jgi:hypothetical protein
MPPVGSRVHASVEVGLRASRDRPLSSLSAGTVPAIWCIAELHPGPEVNVPPFYGGVSLDSGDFWSAPSPVPRAARAAPASGTLCSRMPLILCI